MTKHVSLKDHDSDRTTHPYHQLNSLFSLLLLLIVMLVGLTACSDPVEPTDDNSPSFSHTKAPGESAGDFLTNDRFTRIEVEIDYMPGVEPESDAIGLLEDFLQTRTGKNSVIVLAPTEIPSGEQPTYSANEIRNIEATQRDGESEGDMLSLYCLFLDGDYSEANVLGIAYYNTSCAIFGATIAEITGGPTQPSRQKVESTVLHHEIGHLFGLVNNGLDMQQDHHDEPNGAHCTNESCLMYHAVETTDFFANLFDDSVPEFDEFCVADINAAD